MKKIINFFEKYKVDFFVILVFFSYILAKLLTTELNNLDEVWVFNTARNVANGLLPYKDFNLVTTPGLPIICGLILKIFGTELFYMRIMAAILCTSIIYLAYKNFEILNINTNISILALFGITYIFGDYFCIDYNFVILLLALISLYIELKNIKTNEILFYNKKNEIIIGILAGLAIVMKQTAGLIFAFCVIGYKILSVRNKNDFIKFLKIAITRFAGMFCVGLILLLYLLVAGIFKDFINYAILGVKEFTNSVSYFKLFEIDWVYKFASKDYKTIIIAFLSILSPVTLVFYLIYGFKNNDKIYITLFGFSISTYIIVYPISDNIHFLIGSFITVISLIYFLYGTFAKLPYDKINKKIKIFFISFINAIIIVNGVFFIGIACINIKNKELNTYDQLQNYKNIPIAEGLYESIKSVDEYIEKIDSKAYIVDARSAIFMIPLNRYTKNFDMLLIGNIGKNGSANVINQLDNLEENSKILIIKDECGFNWQTPMDVIDYIKTNYNKIDEINMFNVYERK